LFELLTALPQWGPEYVNVRTCPEVVDIFGGIPQILTPTAAAAQAAFSYKYNYLLGGCDTNDPYTNLGHPTYNAANQLFYSHPFRYVPNASETAMFIDYPQLWACALSSETPTPDNRGFKLVDGVPGAFRVAPGSVASAGNGGFLEPNIFSSDTTFHQTIDDLAPVHNISVAKNAKNLGTGYPAMTGIINVAYCDGSVRGVSVTQGQTPTSSPAKDTFYEQTTVTASGSAGYQLQSTVGIIPGTRFDPMLAP
jgi:prepilin-type processing-associated H-X9-DG protein